jgi:hypothetical protein
MFLAELNLVSAGFTDARLLSRKFVTLYSLCRDLLSKQVRPIVVHCRKRDCVRVP